VEAEGAGASVTVEAGFVVVEGEVSVAVVVSATGVGADFEVAVEGLVGVAGVVVVVDSEADEMTSAEEDSGMN
jgi:hypothetical protein